MAPKVVVMAVPQMILMEVTQIVPPPLNLKEDTDMKACRFLILFDL